MADAFQRRCKSGSKGWWAVFIGCNSDVTRCNELGGAPDLGPASVWRGPRVDLAHGSQARCRVVNSAPRQTPPSYQATCVNRGSSSRVRNWRSHQYCTRAHIRPLRWCLLRLSEPARPSFAAPGRRVGPCGGCVFVRVAACAASCPGPAGGHRPW
eukprot:7170704-Prymnesium_polylepis.1